MSSRRAHGWSTSRLVRPRRSRPKRSIPLTDEFAAGVEAFRAHEGLRYDLLHSHYWLSVAAGESLAASWGVPHLAMFHTLAEVKLRARASEHEPGERIESERRLVHAVDRIVAATQHERQLLRQVYRVPTERIAVMPLGVDLEQFAPADRAAARAAIGMSEDERVLLAVGRIEPLKGFDILIRALGEMTVRDKVTLLVIGGDERAAAEFARLEAVAREVGVEDRVRFLGAVPHETSRGLLQRGGRRGRAVVLRVVRPGGVGGDGLRRPGRGVASWRPDDDDRRRSHGLPHPVALP